MVSNSVWHIVTGGDTWIYYYDPKTEQQSTVWLYQDEPKLTKVALRADLLMELEGGHRNSVIKRRNPIEFGLFNSS
ncbi:hypothetical protein EVAR_9893_1 [Eumeta japonica]|uniref:Mariner Mos1 transposase n=1 Tax=Eumeta variegata TaxID=151549 RepID=A0A4C1TQE9_EUMVA|nr:hypothetical protein EVAR_9893_1 [Eumeta japonica]